MKSIIHSKGCLHVETPNGIVNIRVGLNDSHGRSVDSVSIIPDDRFSGENKCVLRGTYNNRIVRLKTVKC